MNRLSGKVAIVTGGASGIGRATSILMAQEGATVGIADLDGDAAQHVASEIVSKGGKAQSFQMDATSENSVRTTIDAVMTEFSRIDILVNNVGMIGADKPTHEMTEAEWDRVMNVNVKSCFFCTKHVIGHMKTLKGGSIINMSSVHGLIGSPDFPANHASKAAIRLMSKTDAMLYAKDGIRVNSIHPGYIWTPLLENVAKSKNLDAKSFRDDNAHLTPLGHMGSPEDVAFAVVYLASDESKFVTASELVVDGGYTGGRL
jgi:NAD(P)-dependent dehydrogenase (short-subunit alcohol dehydrogenase family)